MGFLPVAAVVAQYLDQQRQQNDAREKARQGVQQNYAASLGYPMAGVQAAEAKNAIGDIEGQDYLTQLLPLLSKRR